MSRDIEVDHLTDWSVAEWWLHYLAAAAAPALTAALFVAGFFALEWLIARYEPGNVVSSVLGGVSALIGLALVVGGIVAHGMVLYDVLRHTSSWSKAVIAVTVVAVVLCTVAFSIAMKSDLEDLRGVAAIAVAPAVIPVLCLVTDGLTRVAASIPMALGTMLGLGIVAVVCLVFWFSTQD